MKQQEIEKARRRVAEMDKVDRESGFARPVSGGASALIRTAMLAIEADCPADAYIYLEQAIKQTGCYG